jgi:hypothetical protein
MLRQTGEALLDCLEKQVLIDHEDDVCMLLVTRRQDDSTVNNS